MITVRTFALAFALTITIPIALPPPEGEHGSRRPAVFLDGTRTCPTRVQRRAVPPQPAAPDPPATGREVVVEALINELLTQAALVRVYMCLWLVPILTVVPPPAAEHYCLTC
jgi:hypothetical protein